ncbi:MAG: PEP/pyruvate-binding domain-containing protein [Pseudomonadota bacterium]
MLRSFFNKVVNLMFRQDFRDFSTEYDPELIRFFLSDGYEQIKNRYSLFNTLLSENNVVMDILNGLQERVDLQLVSLPYFKDEVAVLLDRIISFVQALKKMSADKYDWLLPIAENIKAQIEKKLETEGLESTQRLYFLKQVSAVMTGEVGAKASNLGEVKNILHFPVSRGLVFSFLAYRELITHNKIDELIRPLMADLRMEDSGKIQEASSRIQKAIIEAEIPHTLQEELNEKLSEIGDIPFFAVRSSAFGEDGTYSFAGQFRSVLGVPRTGIPDAFKDVCASLFEERAIQYRLAKGIPQDETMAMGVLVLEMIPTVASGVLYTLDPDHPEADHTLITAVWGLGKYAVDGNVQPDVYVLDRKVGGNLFSQTIGEKHIRLVPDPDNGGVKSEPVPAELQKTPCLKDEALSTLYEYTQIMERHFGAPQDVEWAIDERGWIFILQSRPLSMVRELMCNIVEVNEVPVLTGEPMTPGVISGPVFLVRDKTTASVPRGSILVLKTMDPEFAKLIPFASGLIAEMGSTATHLATVAREFHKPTLINAKDAMRILEDVEIITLDTTRGKVYNGRIDSLLKTNYCETTIEGQGDRNLPMIRSIMKDIVPLTLTHIPDNPVLEIMMKPGDFKTVHDIIRYIHEVSVREMFRFGGKGKAGIAHLFIIPRVPLHFYIIDIGGGLEPQAAFRRQIALSDIRSTPFHALCEGITCEGVSWAGSVEFNLGGFFSVVSRSFIQSDVTDEGGKAYVLLSKDYLNLHSRLAYHFTVIDTVCSDISDNNYLSFRFGGGGADADGRAQRALLLKEILTALDFRVNVKGDTVTSLFRGGTRVETEKRIDQLGRLIGFTRQLDMTLRNGKIRERYVKAFLDGNYSIAHQSMMENAS